MSFTACLDVPRVSDFRPIPALQIATMSQKSSVLQVMQFVQLGLNPDSVIPAYGSGSGGVSVSAGLDGSVRGGFSLISWRKKASRSASYAASAFSSACSCV